LYRRRPRVHLCGGNGLDLGFVGGGTARVDLRSPTGNSVGAIADGGRRESRGFLVRGSAGNRSEAQKDKKDGGGDDLGGHSASLISRAEPVEAFFATSEK